MTDVDLVARRLAESAAAKQALAADSRVIEQTAEMAAWITGAIRNDGKPIFFGNGGSAADSTHLAAEFVGRYTFDRDPMPALALADNLSSVTAIGNDYSYDLVFARQLRGLGAAGDVAIGMTTSGNSGNVVEGLREAGGLGLRTVAITGQAGGHVSEVAELCICVPADTTARIQECTMAICHTVCELVEAAIFPR